MTADANTQPPSPLSPADGVQNSLRELIRSGRYKPGERLPGERALTQELNAPRSVVRVAIARLTEEGLISRVWNCRPIVQELSNDPQVPNKTKQENTGDESASGAMFSASRLVALVMWSGRLEQGGAAQQRIFWGMNEELGLAGYHGVFMDLGAKLGTNEANAEREGAHLQYAIDHHFGGVVFYPYAYERNHELVKKVALQMPLVVIDRKLPSLESDYVGLQNREAILSVMSYLIGLGHRRIAYVTKNEPINPVQERLQGYLQALRDNFGNDGYEMVLSMPSMLNDNWPIFDVVFRLEAKDRPTAIVCNNDYDAACVLVRLEALGLDVPGDISLTGCDNLIQTLENGVGLTSLAQPFEQIGAEAARLFLQRTELSTLSPIKIELPAQLIIRDSCTPPSEP